jgi:hypothetical protein
VPVQARAEPNFASMTEEEQLGYALKMSLEGPAYGNGQIHFRYCFFKNFLKKGSDTNYTALVFQESFIKN